MPSVDEDHTHYHGVDKAEEHPSVDSALEKFLATLVPTKPETINLAESNGRVLFSDIRSPDNLPRLARSTRDGYAINYSLHASGEEQSKFRIVGDIRIGSKPDLNLREGEAARVATGSTLPHGTNAVVMIEYATVEEEKDGVAVVSSSRAIKVGENILKPGEDVRRDELLFQKGSRLNPQGVAILSMFGIKSVRVYSKPRVAILSTGDELVDSSSSSLQKKQGRSKTKSESTKIFDATRPFLKAALTNLGASVVDLRIARDDYSEIREKLRTGLKYDGLFLSAGSSVGERDYATRAAASIPGLNMLVHGVAMRPSSPTGLASFRGKPVIFLPGFPTSAIVSFFVFGRPAIQRLSGSSEDIRPPLIRAVLDEGESYSGKKGLTHYVRVRVYSRKGIYVARISKPSEAQYSGWLACSNGIAVIDESQEPELKPGDELNIFLIGQISSEDTQNPGSTN